MITIDGVTGNTLIALETQIEAGRCDDLFNEGKLVATTCQKSAIHFGRTISEVLYTGLEHVMEITFNTGDKIVATSGLMVLTADLEYKTLFGATNIPLFTYDSKADGRVSKENLFITESHFLEGARQVYHLKQSDGFEQNFVVIPYGTKECDYTKGIVIQAKQ